MGLLGTKFQYLYLCLDVYHALTYKCIARELFATYPPIKAQYAWKETVTVTILDNLI